MTIEYLPELTVDMHRHLQSSPMLPELREVLLHALAWDSGRRPTPDLASIIPQLAEAFRVEVITVAPFLAAWRLMYLATSLLDHIQDGDPIQAPWLRERPAAQQQTIVLALYVHAASLLSHLSATGVDSDRVLELHRQWHAAMLRMASGQFRDLDGRVVGTSEETLQHYQEAAQAKTGSAFALALGGTALLCSADEETVEVLQITGEIFGLLLQISDDLGDTERQPNAAPTFPQAHANHHPGLPSSPEHDAAHFAAYAYQAYRSHIAALLSDVPTVVRETVLSFVTDVFQPR